LLGERIIPVSLVYRFVDTVCLLVSFRNVLLISQQNIKSNSYIFFLVWHLLPTHCRCRELLFHLFTHNDTYRHGRTPLDEGSARRRGLYLYNTQLFTRNTSMPPTGFEPAIPAIERPQTYAPTATGIGEFLHQVGKSCVHYRNQLDSGVCESSLCLFWVSWQTQKYILWVNSWNCLAFWYLLFLEPFIDLLAINLFPVLMHSKFLHCLWMIWGALVT
jgi:hypothetical protein